MAKQQTPDTPPPPWTQDDFNLLCQQQDQLGSRISPVETAIQAINERLILAEGNIAVLDPTRAAIPAELTKLVNLGQIYNTAVGAAIQAKLVTNPRVLSDSKYRQQTIDEILSFADMFIDGVCNRHGVQKAKTKIEA